MDFMLVSAWRGCQDLAVLDVLRTRPVQKPSSTTSPRDVGIHGPIFSPYVSAGGRQLREGFMCCLNSCLEYQNILDVLDVYGCICYRLLFSPKSLLSEKQQ